MLRQSSGFTKSSSSLTVFSKSNSPKPTEVFDTYWKFAAERQLIFFRRWLGRSFPWTSDEILRDYKFTNVYRASDRVSQYLIRNVIYDGNQAPREVFFRIIVFKLFNKIETWELLTRKLGSVRFETYQYELYDEILSEAMARRTPIYSAAYIMPSRSRDFRSQTKHQNHLKLLEHMMSTELPERLADAKTMESAFSLLRSYPMMGDFLAYQFVTDINYSGMTSFSESEFVVAGPGAIDGIAKCFECTDGMNETDIIRMMAERPEREFERLELNFETLWGRPVQLIDYQNLFCEVSKYSRVAHPNIRGADRRTRIKQRFKASPEPLSLWYPPKWGLNDRLRAGANSSRAVASLAKVE